MFGDDLKLFKEFVEGMDDNFHEPDEQGIRFTGCVGTMLDNAFSSSIIPDLIANGSHEVLVTFSRDTDEGTKYYVFNLADILALAKKGLQ